jgi:hypothetical protein
LNIDRNPIEEMKNAESKGWTFDFGHTAQADTVQFESATTHDAYLPMDPVKVNLPKRKSSLGDEFELEIDNLNLDDQLDTSVCISMVPCIKVLYPIHFKWDIRP